MLVLVSRAEPTGSIARLAELTAVQDTDTERTQDAVSAEDMMSRELDLAQVVLAQAELELADLAQEALAQADLAQEALAQVESELADLAQVVLARADLAQADLIQAQDLILV